jgi:superfamily II DNA or RNA helicase
MSALKAYGLTPWGAWFIDALLGFDESGRLARGLSYANTGKVAELEVEGCVARARVQGHSMPWYSVSIAFKPLPEREREKLFALIEEEPMLLARIASGDSPPELIERLKKEDVELIPARWSDMRRACDCPDWGDPCKHMAAVYYTIAKAIDRDPRLLFRLRGIDLGARFGAERKGEVRAEARAKPPYAPVPRRLPDGAPAAPHFGSYLNFILSLTPPRPAFCPGDFSTVLAEFYHEAARAALSFEDGAGRPEESGLERLFSSARYSVLMEGGRPSLSVEPGVGARRRLSLLAAGEAFLGFSSGEGSEGYRFLFYLFRLLASIRSASAFAPEPERKGDALRVVWRPLPKAREVNEALDELARFEPGLLAQDAPKGSAVSGRATVELLSEAYLSQWVQSLRFRPRGERAAERAFVELFFGGRALDVSRPGERELPEAIGAWLAVYSLDFGRYRYRLTIEADRGSEAAFRLGLAVLPPAEETPSPGATARAATKPVELKDAGKRLGLEALRAPAALSSYLPELLGLSSRRRIRIEEERLAFFLGEAGRLLSRLGVEVAIPKALRKELKPRLVLAVDKRTSGPLTSYLDLEGLLSYDWRVAVGDELLDLAAFERLVKSKRPLVLFRDGFARLDPAEAARLIERAKEGRGREALGLIAARAAGDAVFSADAEELVGAFLAEREFPLPAGLKAELRPYQERGYRWAMSNLERGFGCIIADDMGLGKTIEAIAVMLGLEEEGRLDDGVLVVAPAALLTNWERELARFAPGLSVSRYHGAGRRLDGASKVRLSTYQTVARDARKLAERPFSLLLVDEAHLLKNAAAKQTEAVKSLGAAHRLALSGTPVENRLEDLRSLFDFAVPGYLGASADFRREWRIPIEVGRDAEKAERLRRVTGPFLLRRLKTDRSIIEDLPEKVEIDEYAKLSGEQAALYESVVQKGLEDAAAADSQANRRALVLKLITSLKEVCDHPRVYDKESPPEAALSGKCGLLLSLLEEILEGREKVIVFSQYVETLRLLASVIGKELSEEALLYHGGMSKRERDLAVDRFQNEASARVFLVSLKAGGLGLNLTAASRVIHYDLWFNPAVESQATDRAFRIGQRRNVFVHRFITEGTFEEKIDAMLKSKRELADMSVASGESWLSRMSDAELKEIFG